MTTNTTNSDSSQWPEAIFEVLCNAGVTQVAYVPDAGHARLIELCIDNDAMHSVALTSEEEGVALLCGAWLGGARGVLLMQSSGVGNCINMLSVVQECRFPLLTIVTMRGEWGEFNPWQVPMGQGVSQALENAGVIVQHVDDAGDLAETVAAASELAFNAFRAVAVSVSQRILGSKEWK
ncbi:MAG: thiamine pyrophosphate-binding protein [Gammaproteobacteria bacterium]|jgi:sulfopyruvate decarboxylase alpha subunit|nr:thiamine pyrophosphate-binding protein [Gammaproteobacteria bacterium]MDX2458819.1 thiamine pyrophosphate-binding protein [Gammaproteobacteria bacterium]